MTEQAAFFRFDTNANAVAANITAAMAQINSTLSRPLSASRLQLDTQGFGQGFSRLESELVAGQQRIKGLMADLGSGAINRSEFKTRFEDSVRGTVGRIPQVMADQLALAPRAVAGRLDARGIGTQVAQDYVQGLVGYAKANRGAVGDALAGFRFDPRKYSGDVAAVAARPVAYGSETTPAAALQNRILAENLVKQDLAGGVAAQERERRLGIERLTASVRSNQVLEGEQGGLSFIPSGATAELAELNRLKTQSESTGQRLQKTTRAEMAAFQGEAIAINQVHDALRAVDRGKGQLFGPNGQPLKVAGAGVAPQDNVVRAENARQTAARYNQEVADGQRLHAVGAERVGTSYRIMNGEIFKLTAAGAKRVTNELEIENVLKAQGKQMQSQILSAERIAAADAKRTAHREQGFLGGAMGRFTRGDQSIQGGLGSQFASAASFSLAYGSLFAIQAVLRDTMKEFLDYQDSVTDLEVATRGADIVTASWVNTLSELSRVSGSNVGAAIDSAARGVRAFTEPGATDAQMFDAGNATAEAANKLALIANKPSPDATGDVVAIGTAFELQADQLNQVVDAVANAKRNLGGDASQISQGLSLISLSAQQAGYNLDEAASLISLVQARTDQSGQAIATRLTRIFQIVAGSTGKGLAREMGVDADASTKEQIESYAKIYANPNTSEAVKDRISSSLGGTANLRELLPLLKENDRLQAAYAEALNNTGQGTDEFNRKSDNLVGTLKKIAGDLSNLQVKLAQSGIFDAVGIGLLAIEPGLYALESFIGLLNDMSEEIPGLKTVLGLLIDIAIASKAIAVFKTVNLARTGGAAAAGTAGVAAAGSGAAGAAAATGGAAAALAAREREALAILATTQERVLAELKMAATITGSAVERAAAEARVDAAIIAAAEARVLAERAGTAAAVGTGKVGIAGGARSLGKFVTNPWVAATAAVVGLGFLIGKQLENQRVAAGLRDDFANTFAKTDPQSLSDFLNPNSVKPLPTGGVEGSGSALTLQAAARDLNAVAGEIRKTDVDSAQRPEMDDMADFLEERAGGLEYLAKLAVADDRMSLAAGNLNVIGGGAVETVGQLAQGLADTAAAGGTALTAMKLLNKTLNTPPPKGGNKIWDPGTLSREIVSTLQNNLATSLEGEGVSYQGAGIPRALPGSKGGTSTVYTPVTTVTDATKVAQQVPMTKEANKIWLAAIEAQIKNMGLNDDEVIAPDQIEALTRAAAEAADFSGLNGVTDSVIDSWVQSAMQTLVDPNTTDPRELLNARKLTPKQYASLFHPIAATDTLPAWEGVAAIHTSGIESLPSDVTGKEKEGLLKANLAALLNRKRAAGGIKISEAEEAITNARNAYVDQAIANIEDLREAAESRATSNKQLRKIRLAFAKQAFKRAGSNRNVIEQLMESMDRKTVESVIDYLRTARDVARTAYEHAVSLITVSSSLLGLESNGPGKAPPIVVDPANSKKAKRTLQRANAALKAANEVLAGPANITEDIAELEGSDETTAEDRAAARVEHASAVAGARAARLGGGIASSQAALTSARASLANAARGTTEWYQALASFYEAQWQMKEAVLAYATTRAALEGDNTDPVEQARDALQIARLKLRQSKGAGKDVRAEARLGAETSEDALEKAKWDQKLSDMQTAEQLGRISFQTYSRYLQNESDRMHKMHGKTRQQIDHMNEIDLALKEATQSMEGQFNLGNIDTRGFVYAVRRFTQEAKYQGSPTASQIANSNTVNNVTINGADIREVRRMLTSLMGNDLPRRTTAPRRR